MAHDTRNRTSTTSTFHAPRARYAIVFALIAAAAVLIVVRYGRIMVSSAPPPSPTALGPFERGPILDRNGRILAVQTELETVWAWRPDIADPAAIARELAPLIGQNAAVVESRLQGRSGSVTIKRTISPAESEAIRAARSDGGLQGIRLRPDYGRSYPEQASLGPVLGYVGADGYGLAGIERTMESELSARGTNGFGNQVFLTIDMNIQYESERLAREALAHHKADWVTILTLDATNGGILGYASVPGFDPNSFGEYTDEQRRNRPIAGVYEPGSAFKVFTVASFLQLGGIGFNSTFLTDGAYRQTSPPIRDLTNYGTVDTPGIVRLSSNVAAAIASETVTERAFYNMLRLFGFGEETGIELNGEERGLLARPETWSGRTKATLAIGQEIAVTALQMAAGATVFTNNGVLLKPNIVEKVVSPNGRLLRGYGRTPVREVVSPTVASQILSSMEQAVSQNGTAWRLAYPGVRVGAKTGTAEKPDPATGRYSQTAFIASTLAILPVDAPRAIVYMLIDYPKGEEFLAGRIVAPVLREYFDFLVPYLSIPVGDDRRVAHPGRVQVTPVSLPPITERIPDYSGLPKRVLIPLLDRDDISVHIEGFGWVASQDPPAGTSFERGMTLRLELE